MSELQRLKGLLPPENQSWVFVEAAAAIDPPLIDLEEIGRDEVEIQIDIDQWENLALDHRNLLFWHEVGLYVPAFESVEPFELPCIDFVRPDGTRRQCIVSILLSFGQKPLTGRTE